MPATQDYVIPCPQCGTKNRIPAAKTHDRGKCGKCGAPLDLSGLHSGKPVVVTDRNFEQEVLKSSLPVLLDCWAPWCGPCRMVGPVIDQLAGEWQGRVKVGKLNTDENPRIAGQFQIRSIPTMMIFKGGQLADTLVGALPKEQIIRKMQPYL